MRRIKQVVDDPLALDPQAEERRDPLSAHGAWRPVRLRLIGRTVANAPSGLANSTKNASPSFQTPTIVPSVPAGIMSPSSVTTGANTATSSRSRSAAPGSSFRNRYEKSTL